MAYLSVTEYSLKGWASLPLIPAPPVWAETASYGIPIAAGPQASPPFQPGTGILELNCDVACCLAFLPEDAPVAVDGKGRMSAGETRFVLVHPGAFLSVIKSTT